MPTLTVRDIPDRVYDRLRERARQNRRSLSGEIVTLLEERLLPQPVDAEVLIAEAEAFHAQFSEPLPDLVAEGKRAGRKFDANSASGDPSGEDRSSDEVAM